MRQTYMWWIRWTFLMGIAIGALTMYGLIKIVETLSS